MKKKIDIQTVILLAINFLTFFGVIAHAMLF